MAKGGRSQKAVKDIKRPALHLPARHEERPPIHDRLINL